MEKNPDPRIFAINAYRANEFHLQKLSEANGRFAAALEQSEAPGITQIAMPQHHPNIYSTMFRMAWPIWRVYRGRVPTRALRNLEKDGDWPPGTAVSIMERINRDEDLRFELETGHRL